MINKLFIYGSLLETDNEFGRYLKKQATVYKPGIFRGKLYDAGEYPGAIYLPDTDYNVHGTIIQLTNAQEALKIIDDYEGSATTSNNPIYLSANY